MHREEQILQAAKTAIESFSGIGAQVFIHQTLSLDPESQELPGICINTGADTPIGENGYSNQAFIDSLCEFTVTLYAQGSTQEEVAQELDRMRVAVHKALMASPRTLGLSFVMIVGYGAAGVPEYGGESSPLAASRECTFSALYRMDIDDPE